MSKLFESIKAIEFDKNRDKKFGLKSAILWAHSKNTNGIYPLVYISKPKGLSQEEFDEVIDHLHLDIRYGSRD